MSVLDEIIDGVRVDLAERQGAVPLDALKDAARRAPDALDPMSSFRAAGVSVIAEVKRSSPSKGALATISDPAALALGEVDADAVDDLVENAHATPLP